MGPGTPPAGLGRCLRVRRAGDAQANWAVKVVRGGGVGPTCVYGTLTAALLAPLLCRAQQINVNVIPNPFNDHRPVREGVMFINWQVLTRIEAFAAVRAHQWAIASCSRLPGVQALVLLDHHRGNRELFRHAGALCNPRLPAMEALFVLGGTGTVRWSKVFQAGPTGGVWVGARRPS